MSTTDKVVLNKHPKDAPPHRKCARKGSGGIALNKHFLHLSGQMPCLRNLYQIWYNDASLRICLRLCFPVHIVFSYKKHIERNIKSITYPFNSIDLQLSTSVFCGLNGRDGYTAHFGEAVDGDIPLCRQFIYSFYSFQEAALLS